MNKNYLPDHIAIILDGNGRWAKQRNLPRTAGHKKGVETLVDIVKYAKSINLKYLTVFAFSTENWNRPKDEVDYLMNLIKTEFLNHCEDLKKDNIRLRVIGFNERLDLEIISIIKKVEEDTIDNTGLNLTIAFNYGSQGEIVLASKRIAQEVVEGKLRIEDITKEEFNKHLLTNELPYVDLLIRTSGEERISNFMLWQISYSELYFTKTLWPDYSSHDLDEAIEEFQKRDRRFGGVKK